MQGTLAFLDKKFARPRVLRLAYWEDMWYVYYGRDSWTRTSECKSQSLVPCQLGYIPVCAPNDAHRDYKVYHNYIKVSRH